jgi:hypothetical protein
VNIEYEACPLIVHLTPEEIEVLAAHEWMHAFLWCRSVRAWTDEFLVDRTLRRFGYRVELMEHIRFGRPQRNERRSFAR